MALADSLLSAIVRADGDALVMHVGERPYVVVGTSTINISTHGLNLEANIVLAENKEVMVIPRAALQKGDSVWVKKDGEELKVPVKTGIADDQWVEIKSGLDKSSTIILK